MAREYRYLLVDVFTKNPFEGNQLAVFLDADGLRDEEMQALARETNLSETTFCLPRERELPGAGSSQAGGEAVRVRIFTTDEELPFAGLPTLGTATVLRWVMPELRDVEVVTLRLDAGRVPVRFSGNGADEASRGNEPGARASAGLPFGSAVQGEMEQPLPQFGRRHDRAAVAAALGLPPEAIDRHKPIQTVSTGLPFVIVPLMDREALQSLSMPQQAAERYLRASDGKFFYVIAQGASPTEWYARMQFYAGEDPATGSAAGCATAYLVHHGYAPQRTRLTLRQGAEIFRPSTLFGEASLARSGALDRSGNAAESNVDTQTDYVRVAGSTVLVAEGRFFLQ